ncbi:MAG TPA: hypothetical protein VIK86_08275 [Candidatus Paceibacterota bacterium]
MKKLKLNFEETEINELKKLFKTEDENEAVRKAITDIISIAFNICFFVVVN